MLTKTYAQLVSVVTNPFLVLFLALYIHFEFEITQSEFEFGALFISAFAICAVMYLVVLQRYKDTWLQHIDLNRRERVYILFAIAIGFSFITGVSSLRDYSQDFQEMVTLLTIYWGVMALLTMFITKVSLHASMLLFMSISIFNENLLLMILGLVLFPLMFWSRKKLHKHTFMQLILGSSVGLIFGGISIL